MNDTEFKISHLFMNQKVNLKFLKRFILKLKQPLCLMVVITILSACAAFSGRETAGEYVDDASITASVKNALIQDSSLKAHQIHVETFKNQVQLSGFVDSSREVMKAGQIAKNISGVESVKNSIVVRKRSLRGR